MLTIMIHVTYREYQLKGSLSLTRLTLPLNCFMGGSIKNLLLFVGPLWMLLFTLMANICVGGIFVKRTSMPILPIKTIEST